MDSLINSAPSRDWAKLPTDLLYCVLENLTLLSDYIRFGAVCKSWSLSALQQKQKHRESIQQEPPLLLIPVADNLEERNLYSVCEGKTYNCRFSIPFRKRCCGSSYGWWVITENNPVEKVLSITLLNPFLGNTIHLPPIITVLNPKKEPEFLVHKVILSCDPSLYPNDYVVAAIYAVCHKIAFIRPGDKSWNVCLRSGIVSFVDILFHENLLYAMTSKYLLAVDYKDKDEDEGERTEINKLLNGAPIWLVATDHVYSSSCYKPYLAESSSGNLLLIRKVFYWGGVEKLDRDTIKFEVYRLQHDHKEGKQKWVKLSSLENDDALFLGPNHSICISASRFPNCRPNSIYYTDQSSEVSQCDPSNEVKDLGVFHLEDGSHGDHFNLDPSLCYMTAWISPVLK